MKGKGKADRDFKMITFSNLTEEKIDSTSLLKLGKKVLKGEGIKNSEEICCVFTDNAHIQDLNSEYRNRNFPTDVLAFSFTEGVGSDFREHLLGDVYISVDMARENAKSFKVSLSYEIKLLFIHGLLHLLNYEDKEGRERKKMDEKTKYYLSLSY